MADAFRLTGFVLSLLFVGGLFGALLVRTHQVRQLPPIAVYIPGAQP